MSTELWLVRHGETEENVAAILQGHLPGTLTPRGIQQAEALRDTLRGTHFDAFLVSDLCRTVHTAEILQPAVGLPIIKTPLLRERDWGRLTGCKIADVQGRDFTDEPSVESVEAMFARAHQFLSLVARDYAGQRVLAVTHGLFARCLRAAHAACTIRDIPRMSNAEVCRLELPSLFSPSTAPTPQSRIDSGAADA